MKKIFKHMFFIAVGAFVLIAGVAALVWFGLIGKAPVLETPAPQLVADNGGLFITYAEGEAFDSGVLALLDVSAGKMSTIASQSSFFSPSRSSDGTVTISIRGVDGASYIRTATNTQSFLSEETAVAIVPENGGQVGNTDRSSGGTKVVYESVFEPAIEGESRFDVSEVVVYDAETETHRFLDLGLSPFFIDDTHIMYLREDGVYEFDLSATSTQESVRPLYFFTDFYAGNDSRIVLSPDKKKVFITHPQEKLVTVHEVAVTDAGVRYLQDGLKAQKSVLFASFSPDSSQIVLLEDVESNSEQKHVRILDLTSFAERTITTIPSKQSNLLSLGTWYE